jgi:protein-tyrosine-phosphatase
MTVARRLERVSDQAKNLCEDVLYICTGEFSKHKGAEEFRILFLDANNACLSQMAEGIVNALHLPQFRVSSAGVTPQSVEAATVKFMAGKGIDISKQTSKSLEQVPGWEHCQVIVTLSASTREALPAPSSKTIFFSWSIDDPSRVDGSDVARQAAFESAYQSLASHVRELVGAILQEPQPQAELKLS